MEKKKSKVLMAVIDKLLTLDKKKIIFISVMSVMGVAALGTALIFACSLVPVTRFELSGVVTYDKSEIISLSGIDKGMRMGSIKTDEVEERLLSSCPKIENVTVEKRFPNKVVFRIEEKTPEWYIEVSGSYYVLAEDMMVIEETVNRQKLIDLGVPQLILPELRSLILGQIPEFGDKNDKNRTDVVKSLELIAAIRSTNFKSRMTLVDVESRFDVNIVIDGKYKVYMGDVSNVEEKLKAVEKILKSDQLKGYAGAEIDTSIPATISVRPIYTEE